MIGGNDDVVNALVNPVALTQEIHLSPATRDQAEFRVTWQGAHQRLRLRSARQLAALQDLDGVWGCRHAAGLDPEHGEPCQIRDEEEGETRRGLANEYLPNLAALGEERRRMIH